MKTYGRKAGTLSSNASAKSVDAVNALFAQNLTKRLIGKKRKRRLKIKELPPSTGAHFRDESLKVAPDDTFDKLRKGTVFNEVRLKTFVKMSSSESSKSVSKLSQVSVSYRSPILTRRRRKQVAIVLTEVQDSSSQTKNETSTLDKPVVSSLYIENEKKQLSFPSLSYIKVPVLVENGALTDSNQLEASYEPIFSATFREKQTVHSSTPLALPVTRIVADKISPISSGSSTSSNIIEKSYDVIRKWDSSFPKIVTETPLFVKSTEQLDSKKSNKRLLGEIAEFDWKLHCEPKVYLRTADRIDMLTKAPGPDVHGFTTEEQQFSTTIYDTYCDLIKEISVKSKKSNVRKKSRRRAGKKGSSQNASLEIDKSVNDFVTKRRVRATRMLPDTPKLTKKLIVDLAEFNRFVEIHSPLVDVDQAADKKKTPPRLTNSKIIILSDTKLDDGWRRTPSGAVFETCQNIWHDHSYHSPKPSGRKWSQSTPQKSNSKITQPRFTPISTKQVEEHNQKSFRLSAGKAYRRSLLQYKRFSTVLNTTASKNCGGDCPCPSCPKRQALTPRRRGTLRLVPNTVLEESSSVLQAYASYVREKELFSTRLDDSFGNLSLNGVSSLINDHLPFTAKDLVLQRCGQEEIQHFEECYPKSILQNCQKIGEGVYGEVFLYRNRNGGKSVMKVIPIEGDQIVNGETQKKFEEVLSEITITMELSNLRNNERNKTCCFTEVQNVRCIQGGYPERLLELWDLYHENHRSENESPEMFNVNQLYITLELADSGKDLEAYEFRNGMQAFSMFQQIACALAVAESQLQFEHRDLHWGNILVNNVDKDKTLQFRLNGVDIDVNTFGAQVTIIDFTLSRMLFDDVIIFNDLSCDNDLFAAKGDYQFEIYRLMKKRNGNDWKLFEPYSNVLWLDYVLDKCIKAGIRYKNPRAKVHREYMTKLKNIRKGILLFRSAVDFVNDYFM